MRVAARAGCLLALCALLACGKKGPPAPPLPRGPLAPENVAARQRGEGALVLFGVPRPREATSSAEAVRAELLRVSYPPGVQPGADPDAFRRRGEVVGFVVGDPLPAEQRIAIEDDTWARLPAAAGSTLRYAVRLRDRRMRPSALGVAADLVPLESPGPVPRLDVEPTADGVRLTWEGPLPGENDVGYNVYRSEPEGPVPEEPLHAEPVRANEYLDAEAVVGKTYVYEVRQALAAGPPPREGLPSEPRQVLAEDRFAPEAPAGLLGVQEGRAVRLFWNPGRERDIAGYRIERRRDAGEWVEAATSLVVQPSWFDPAVEVGERLEYRVAAVDRAGNQGAWSAPADVVVSAEPSPPQGEAE